MMMNEAPKVSVIIPVYNAEKYLRQCLDSVLNQTLQDIEIICVDDGSTDCSSEILLEYSEKDVRINVLTQKNQGQSAARNNALGVAAGEYVAFLDSDDFYVENALAELYTLARSETADIIGFNAFPLFENKNLEMRFQAWKTYYARKQIINKPISGLTAMNLLTQNSEYRPSACLLFYRRSFLEEKHIRFYEGIIHEDNLFTFQCFVLAKRVMQVSEQYYGRRAREDSTMTQVESVKNLRGYFLCLINMLRSLKNIEMTEAEEESLKKNIASMWYAVQRLHKNLPQDEIWDLLQCSKLDERVLFDLFLKIFPPKYVPPDLEIKVSVIIFAHNAERYIWDCLDSVLAQSFEGIEIICINADSTDNTAYILNVYARRDKAIKIIETSDISVCELLKISLEKTKGKYLYFINAEDFIAENLITNLYQCGEIADVDVVVSFCNFYDADNHISIDKQSFVDSFVDLQNRIVSFTELGSKRSKLLFSNLFNKFILRDFAENNRINDFEDSSFCNKFFSEARRVAMLNLEQRGYYIRMTNEEERLPAVVQDPLVSVIIPVYNSERFLWECLDSLRKQTLKNIEIICVDDGSTDNSMYVLQECQKIDPRIKIMSQENQYAGVARNNGLQEAKGEYVIFLDADDFFDADMLRSLYGRAKAYAADICVCKGQYFKQKTKEIEPMPWSCNTKLCPAGKAVFSKEDLGNKLFLFTSPAPWTKLFRREFVQSNNLQFQKIRTANDVAFVMSALALAERITVLDQYLIYYRTDVATTLQATKLKEPFNFYNALIQLKNNLNEHDIFEEVSVAYANLALDICYHNLRVIKDASVHKRVYQFLRNTGFYELGVVQLDSSQVHDRTKYAEFNNVMQKSWSEYVKAKGLFQPVKSLPEKQSGNENNNFYYQEIQKIYASKSFRIGRFITYIPRKVRGGIRCYKEHGMGYTLERVKTKFVGLFGGSNK